MDKKERQSFDEKEQSPHSLPSRLEVHGRKNKKKVKQSREEEYEEVEEQKKKGIFVIPLILLVILLLLPAGIYAFIKKDLTLKSQPPTTAGEEISIEDYTNEPVQSNEEDEEIKKGPNDKEDQEPEENQEESKQNEKEPEKIETENKETPKKNSPEQKEKEVKQKEEVKPPATEENNVQDDAFLYHTVKSGETLYRISMTYYKSSDGIEKIRAANGITGNEINAGQTLKIPKP